MMKKSSDPDKVRRIQELRRSNAATRVASGKEYNRAKAKQETKEEDTQDGN